NLTTYFLHHQQICFPSSSLGAPIPEESLKVLYDNVRKSFSKWNRHITQCHSPSKILAALRKFGEDSSIHKHFIPVFTVC
uniref:Uncharacterized protein n=1 Tax=Taeniopygia guttata TaxID=59729 RepID=A0A674H4Z0_TAEGU